MDNTTMAAMIGMLALMVVVAAADMGAELAFHGGASADTLARAEIPAQTAPVR